MFEGNKYVHYKVVFSFGMTAFIFNTILSQNKIFFLGCWYLKIEFQTSKKLINHYKYVQSSDDLSGEAPAGVLTLQDYWLSSPLIKTLNINILYLTLYV